MTTEEKIREAFRKYAREHDDIYDDLESFKAGYLAAQKEAFEQAAKVCEEQADLFNGLYSREAAGAICCKHEIRQLIKE